MLLHKDPLLRKVAWKDLAVLSLKDKLVENLVSLPWLAASLYFAGQPIYWAAIPCSFMFFLTALRVVHNSFHKTLGLAKQANELTMYAYSLLMCVSIHAVCYNHLRHHSHCLQEEDVEGSCARMPAWKAFLYGPVFIFKIHTAAWKSNGFNRKKMVLELLLLTTFLLVAFVGNIPFLQYHALAMLVGELFSSFLPYGPCTTIATTMCMPAHKGVG